jgi:hypothetical protein
MQLRGGRTGPGPDAGPDTDRGLTTPVRCVRLPRSAEPDNLFVCRTLSGLSGLSGKANLHSLIFHPWIFCTRIADIARFSSLNGHRRSPF